MPTVQPVTLDRDSLARWYAISHLKTDPGIVEVHYLPTGSDDNEIRFVEVNTLIEGRRDDSIEVIDFGIDFGKETYHRLLVLDVTPSQWSRIKQGQSSLPPRWSRDHSISYDLNDSSEDPSEYADE